MSDDALIRIREWCDAEPTLDFADGEPPTVTVAGDDAVVIDLELTDDRVGLQHERSVKGGGALAAEVRDHLGGRGSLLSGSAAAGGGKVKVTLDHRVYRDGLSRQAFITAVLEIAGAADAIEGLAAQHIEPAATPEPAPAEHEPPAVAPDAATAVPDEATAATQAAQEATEATAAAAAETVATQPAPVAASAGPAPWAPTHRVPDGGLRAWAAPDPSQPHVAELAARVELSVDEVRGAWARVTGSNGWTGWVDNRRLLELGGGTVAGAAGAAGATGTTSQVNLPLFQLLPAAAALIAVFVPWLQLGSNNAFDFSFTTLYSRDDLLSGQGGFSLGILLLIAAGAMVAGVLVKNARQALPAGAALAIVVGLAFALQVILLVTDAGNSFMDAITDGISGGPWVAIGAGVLGLIAHRTR